MKAAKTTGTGPPARPDGPGAALAAALRRILTPLVRLLIARQVPYAYLAGLLKEIYVDVAERDFPVPGKPQTDSRIHLLTGVHRKDVKRLRGRRRDADTVPEEVSLGGLVIARWIGLPEYLDRAGRPRPLPRFAREAGGAPSFEGLVRSVSRDIRPRAVLDDWLAKGLVRLDAEDRVVLDVEAFVPDRDFDEKSYFLGRNVHDHIAAAVENLLTAPPPFLDRSAHYSGLTELSVREIETLAREQAMQALKAVNRRALVLQKRDRGRPDATRRVNFGAYVFTADEADEGAGDPDGGDPARPDRPEEPGG